MVICTLDKRRTDVTEKLLETFKISAEKKKYMRILSCPRFETLAVASHALFLTFKFVAFVDRHNADQSKGIMDRKNRSRWAEEA